MVRWAPRVRKRSNGFSLIELSIAMVVMGLLISVAFKMMPGTTERMRLDATETGIIAPANKAIIGFLAANDRLPCPDTSGDGAEDCGGAVVGDFPYATVGLSGPLLDSSKVPIRYGVYRNPNGGGSDDADLAAPGPPNRYQPVLGETMGARMVVGNDDPATDGVWDSSPTTTTALSRHDICHALQNAAGSGANVYVHTIEGANTPNPAYVLASGGIENADGLVDVFDGANVTGGVAFESPETRRSALYDDIVDAQSFGDIAAMLGCFANKGAVNALAVASVLAENIARGRFLNNEADILAVRQAIQGVSMAEVAIAITAANVAVATANLLIAIEKAPLFLSVSQPGRWPQPASQKAQPLPRSSLPPWH